MKRKKAQQSLVEEDCEEDILTENIQNLSSIEADSFGKNRAKLEASFSCHDLDHDAGSAKSQEIDDGEPPLVLPGGSFDLILVIDQREALSHKDQSAILTSQLLARKIPFTFRTLPIGDFVWICKGRTNNTGRRYLSYKFLYLYLFSEEVTLDYVVERKREDDFISSILDGRYEEQKVRFIHAFLATLGIHAINLRLFHSCIFG